MAHPRLRARAASFGLALDGGSVVAIDPLTYPEMVRAVLASHGVVTDSGGLQKEAFLLGVVCTTLRSETEWVETLVDGWNVLDPSLSRVQTMAVRPRPASGRPSYYGDGLASARVLDAICRHGAGS